jgi:hypothetical protein
MTHCSTYIGDLDDPDFHIDQVLTINLPRHLSKTFPRPREHYNVLFHQWVKVRAMPCKQIDYDGYLVLLTKDELRDYIAYVYDSDPSYTNSKNISESGPHQHEVKRLKEIKTFITTLDPGRRYALIAECD